MLPAYAGMIRPQSAAAFLFASAPRVCGDDPDLLGDAFASVGVLPAYAGMIVKLSYM